MSQKWVQGKLFPVKKICGKCGVEKPLDKFHFKVKRDNTRERQCPECRNAKNRKYREDNREKARGSVRKWKLANRDKDNAHSAKRRAAKLQRTPKWLTKEHYKQMEDMYTKAYRLTEQTGVKYQVDHIIPLRGKNVSGLHVPWNLQVITAAENFSKNNKFEVMQ